MFSLFSFWLQKNEKKWNWQLPLLYSSKFLFQALPCTENFVFDFLPMKTWKKSSSIVAYFSLTCRNFSISKKPVEIALTKCFLYLIQIFDENETRHDGRLVWVMTLKTKRFSLYPLRAFRNILGRLKFVPTKYAEIIFLKYGFHLQIKQLCRQSNCLKLVS